MADTPRTDALLFKIPDTSLVVGRTMEVVAATVARTFERELAQAHALIVKLDVALSSLEPKLADHIMGRRNG